MEFRLLGALEVADGGRALALGGPKQRALLAVLLLHANDVVPTERLIDEVWGESPPATVAKSVQVYVSRLRRQLGDGRLATRTPGYVLHVDPSELDAARFERLVAEAAGADPRTAARTLREALALWRGPAFADLAYEPFAQAEIARLEELRLAALEQRVDADLATGRHAEVAGELEALVAAHPLRERLRGRLMLCLYRSGRQAEALDAYRAARAALVEELGIEPGRELRDLQDAILRQDPALDLRTAPATPAAPPRGTFVGREAELGELVAGLDEAIAGRGRLFLLAGEPGIGKSRLAEELAAEARARGARVLVGRCWEAGGAPAYWPWVQSLRAYVRASDSAALRSELGSGAAELAQIVPELRERFPDLPEPPALESDTARFRLFDAVAAFLCGASRSRPLAVLLDDLHAADAPSLLLLRFVARELGSARILLLGAYRDVDPTPGGALSELLAEVAREPVTRRLSLGALSEPEVAEYVERAAGEIASPALVAAVQAEAEGNPLCVGEIVRLLSVEGVPRGARLAIPEGVRDVIARRLTYLSPECHGALVLASVLGREFALDALARVADLEEDALLDALDEAQAARVVTDVPDGPGRLRFAHVLIRDTLYEGLTSARRVRLHGLVADALEALYGAQPGPHLAELAHHCVAARDFDRGARYARRAGDRGLALLAYEEGARLYETALTALEHAGGRDERTRCDLLLALGDAHSRAGDAAGAKAALLEAAAIARRLGLSHQLGSAAELYGGRIVFARASGDDRLLPLLEEGLAGLGDDDDELRARLLARLAGALRDEPSRARRDAVSAEAVEMARRTGDPRTLAVALDGRAIAIVAPDTVAECIAIGAELREVAERIGDGERVVHGCMHRLGALLMAGDVAAAQADLEAATRVADELRQPAHLWDVCAARAMITLAAGRLDEAEELVEQALAFGERAQPEMVVPVHRVQRATLCELRGDVSEVEPEIRALVAAHPARPVFRCLLAHLHARLGRAADARRALGELAADDAAALPFDQEWLLGMSLLAETAAALDDAGAAAVLHPLLSPWSALNVVDQAEGMRGAVSRYLGLLAATTRRWDEAGRHFDSAIAMNTRTGARPWLAHTQHDLARMLDARGRGEDAARANELRAEAAATYRELGMGLA